MENKLNEAWLAGKIKEPTEWSEQLKELLDEVRRGLKDDVCVYNLIRKVEKVAKEKERKLLAEREIQYWKDVFDKRPNRDRPVMRDADDVAQDFARIEIDKWEDFIINVIDKDYIKEERERIIELVKEMDNDGDLAKEDIINLINKNI